MTMTGGLALASANVGGMGTLAAAPPAPLVSAWVAMPVAAVAVVLLAAHMKALTGADMPESRRRIRTANGWVMLLATPVTAYAFGVATPADPRLFLLAWLAVAGLLAIVLLLAGIDIVNTGRINLDARQNLRRELRDLQHEIHDGPGAPPSRDGRA